MTKIDITSDVLMFLDIYMYERNMNLSDIPIDTVIFILNINNIPYRLVDYDDKEVCLVYNSDVIFGNIINSDKDCSICLDDFKINKKIVRLPCKHVFHEKCLFDTIKYNNSCPMCRTHIQVFLR